jgi:hypothetical protein
VLDDDISLTDYSTVCIANPHLHMVLIAGAGDTIVRTLSGTGEIGAANGAGPASASFKARSS